MGTSYKRAVLADVSTTIEELYETPAGLTTAVNTISLANIGSTEIVGNIELYPLGVAGNNIVLAKDVAIPAGTTYFYKGFRSLVATDEIWVSSDTATAMDAFLSGYETDAASSFVVQGLLQNVPATLTALYTAPLTGATLNDVSVCNTGASAVTFNMSVYPLGVGGASEIVIYKDVSIPPDGIFTHTGAIGLISTDKLMISGSATTLDAAATGTKG
jgi:hypothetical protein